MNPRLAVSILFVLIAVTALRPEANDALKKLRILQHSWAEKTPKRCTAEILNRITSRACAVKSEFHHGAAENQPRRVRSLSPNGKAINSSFPDDANVPSSQERHIQHRVIDLIDSGPHTAALECVTTAVRQIHEVLDLCVRSEAVGQTTLARTKEE